MTEQAGKAVVEYWNGLGEEGWFKQDDAVDAEIRERFLADWEEAAAGGLHSWRCSPQGMLAYLILTDQFPRNMFRGEPRAFETDHLARSAAKSAIFKGWDMRVPEPIRHMYYMPLSHSEFGQDQERSVRLMAERLPEGRAMCLPHAQAHREVIRRFGRFPFRNGALGRTSSAAETAFLAEGGYGSVVREFLPAA